MKTVGVRELQKKIKKIVETSQEEGVVVTRNGKPASLIIGVEGREWEDLVVQADPKFWKLIEKRRQEKIISMNEMKQRVLPGKKNTKKKKKVS